MQRITTAHPEPFTHKHTLEPACALLLHVLLTLDADTSRLEHVGLFYVVLDPKARRCAKNSAATIGIIKLACPTPRHTLPARCSATKATVFKNTNTFPTRSRAENTR